MKVDLNTATAEEFDRIDGLRGHGFEIVRYREERGRFTSLRQLDEVPGLAGKTDGIGVHISVQATGRARPTVGSQTGTEVGASS